MNGGALSDLEKFSKEVFSSAGGRASELLETAGKALYSAAGSRQYTTFHDCVYGIDHTRNTIYMPEAENHGYSFFTRPKLNLTTPSLRSDRILSLLDTLDPQSIAFAIRSQLDTKLSTIYPTATSTSPFFDRFNPFIPILSNRLLTLNGWPDWVLDVETTEGGFFSESITYPKGHDQLTRNYDLQASFADVQGSVVLILFTMWFQWLHLVTKGLVTPYMEDIEDRRMCFTSSIYRFVMDPSKRHILKWAKATGCYPRSVPLGAFFNFDSNAGHVESSMNLSIPFTVAGRIEYYDPIILREFNMLVEGRCSSIKSWPTATQEQKLLLNHRCIPYIDVESGSNELLWKYNPANEELNNLLGISSTPVDTSSTSHVNDSIRAAILNPSGEFWS